MLYEFHVYEVMPGKLRALNDRFADQALGFFKKHDMRVLGFWTEDIGTSNRLTYILRVDSMAESERKWAAFSADQAWREVLAETEREGPLLARTENSYMQLTPYSPEPKISSKVHELRTYEAMPGRLPHLHDRFGNHTVALFKKHGMGIVGFWTEVLVTTNKLVYMLEFPSLADREKSWAGFLTDPDWWTAFNESEKAAPLVVRTSSRILRPTAYSPME